MRMSKRIWCLGLSLTLLILLCACAQNNVALSTSGGNRLSDTSSALSSSAADNQPVSSVAPANAAPTGSASSPIATSQTSQTSSLSTSTAPSSAASASASSRTASAASPSSAASGSTITKTFTFQVNANMPMYQGAATVTENTLYGYLTTTKITIVDAKSGAAIQTMIPPSDNDEFTSGAAFCVDVNFDGSLDLVIPIDAGGAHNNTMFDAYVWDSAANQFIEAPSFQNIHRPSLDPANQRILSSAGNSSSSSSYWMYAYENGQFVQTNSFYYGPATGDQNPVSDAADLIHVIETKGDVNHQTVVNDFYVPMTGFRPNTNAQLNPYYEAGSFWDLNSAKWNTQFS